MLVQLEDILCCPGTDTYFKCRYLQLQLRRNCIRRHDYLALMDKTALLHAQIGIYHLPKKSSWTTYYYSAWNYFRSIILAFCHIQPESADEPDRADNPERTAPVDDEESATTDPYVGGGSSSFSLEDLQEYFLPENASSQGTSFRFNDYVLQSELGDLKDLVACDIPIHLLSTKLPIKQLCNIAACHGIITHSKARLADIQNAMCNHMCEDCQMYAAVFEVIDENQRIQKRRSANLKAVRKYQDKKGHAYKRANLESVKKHQDKQGDAYKATNLQSVKKHQDKQGDAYKAINLKSVQKYQDKNREQYRLVHQGAVSKHKRGRRLKFPPSAPTMGLQHSIISDACNDMSPDAFLESGCVVCGKLTPLTSLLEFSQTQMDLSILANPGVTRKERSHADELIMGLEGPVLEDDSKRICKGCHRSLTKGKMPLMALANGKWIGKIPKELSDLSFAEQLLVARVRHNRCIVRVSSGMHKMRANAITFENPTPKVYDILPPPMEDLDEVLAFIYTGPCKPTKADFERTPLLVRKNRVRDALEWLKLNHCDYYDLEISQRNLDEYPEDGPPVVVDYHQSFTNKDPESTAVHDNECEEGTETGQCPFVVHGLTGEEYSNKSLKTLKAIALKHLTSNQKILAVGHSEQPESIYENPQLFPQMMPWLFPYGLGGIGNDLQSGRLSDIAHKRHLLMYHDKRFQKDPFFPLIAFNHEQIKQGTTGGYLLTEKAKFGDISKRLMDIDVNVMTDLAKRMEDGERVTPETDEEKQCFQLIKDLDHVGGHVKGSLTSKKYMRNEIWSLISFLGAPSWFITFAPADIKHPICLYFADTGETFQPELKGYDDRYRLIAQNPVAGARFFHFMCEIFIKHILGVGTDHRGLYGQTSAFYGAVEQQGRLTLHLHLLLWIIAALSPQEIRDRITDPNSDFWKKMVEYLEGVHAGEFQTGSMDQVEVEIKDRETHEEDYQDPTQTLPDPPPPLCDTPGDACPGCQGLETWWDRFKQTVDDLVFRSNVHDCTRNQSKGEKANKKDRPTCINKYGNCKARFPRDVYPQTEVDIKTGAINVKKGEPWINTFTPVVTFLLRCNTDVTSLLSGTAIKAVVAYVSDYVTKPGLKTYTIFDTIRSVFLRNSEMLSGSTERKEKARKLITKIVNALSAKMEIGGPMASLYLLGNPDHYTSHNFHPVYWKNYVREVSEAWSSEDMDVDDDAPEKVLLQRSKDQYVGISAVHDYVYRPEIHSSRTLYEWVQMAKRVKRSSRSHKADITESSEDELSHSKQSSLKRLNFVENQDILMQNNSDYETEHLNIQEIDSDIEDHGSLSDTETDTEQEEIFPDKEQGCEFLEDHPLHETHLAQFDTRNHDMVPNFVGGSLPRCDRGDREYYCKTMLTLFKPWRTGKDLKSDNYSWDETFMDHQFTECQLQLMNNFNIRYECNDARDDFSTQLKKGQGSGGIFPQWMTTEVTDEIDDFNLNGHGDDFGDADDSPGDEDYGVNKYSTLGPRGTVCKAEMDATENSVRGAGWLDDSPDGLCCVNKEPLKPEVSQNSAKWKAALQEKRQNVLAERTKYIPTTPAGNRPIPQTR